MFIGYIEIVVIIGNTWMIKVIHAWKLLVSSSPGPSLTC